MMLLDFLRVLAEMPGSPLGCSPPPKSRRLAVESLDRRAVLSVLPVVDEVIAVAAVEIAPPPLAEPTSAPAVEAPIDPAPPPVESSGPIDTTTTDPAPVSSSDPTGDPPPADSGGSGDGSGGAASTDPPSDSSGDPTGDPAPTDSGDNGASSGNGSSSSAPVISDLHVSLNAGWVTLVGMVEDDGPVAGLTVYFSTDLGQNFTTTVNSDGSFETYSLMLTTGTQISAYTIDTDGNWSDFALIIA